MKAKTSIFKIAKGNKLSESDLKNITGGDVLFNGHGTTQVNGHTITWHNGKIIEIDGQPTYNAAK